MLAYLLLVMGRLDEAKVELDRWASLEPGNRILHIALSDYYTVRLDLAAALREVSIYENTPDLIGHRGPSLQRAWIYACLGESARAKETLAALKDYPEIQPALVGRAAISAALGDLDECFRLIDRCFDKFGGFSLQIFRLDPFLQSVRRDPRFAGVLKRAKLS